MVSLVVHSVQIQSFLLRGIAATTSCGIPRSPGIPKNNLHKICTETQQAHSPFPSSGKARASEEASEGVFKYQIHSSQWLNMHNSAPLVHSSMRVARDSDRLRVVIQRSIKVPF